MSKVPTHVWLKKGYLPQLVEPGLAGYERYKLVPGPEPDPPQKPQLVWFEYEGRIYFGMEFPGFSPQSYTVCPMLKHSRLLHRSELEELGIVLRTDFAEDEA